MLPAFSSYQRRLSVFPPSRLLSHHCAHTITIRKPICPASANDVNRNSQANLTLATVRKGLPSIAPYPTHPVLTVNNLVRTHAA